MTIKRRIKRSNNLMIVLPMLMTFVLGGILSIIFIGVTGIDPRHLDSDRIRHENVSQAREAIESGEYSIVTEDVTVYKSADAKHIVVLPEEIELPLRYGIMQRYYIPLLFMLFLLTVVFFTNRALTRYVFRGIMTPIDILVSGVHEIRDGNLSYRIEYEQKDEFSAVCADFNEMAQQLSDMVERQQREETNRRELIAGISHDLRTPLTSIKAYIEGIEKGVASSPQMRAKYLETIKSKTIDLEHTINQLFLFSKLDIGEFPLRLEEVDIGLELHSFIERHEKEYSEKGLAVSLAESADNAYAMIDIVQFRNVASNILDNSVKYNENERAEVAIACRRDGNKVKISFTDNGPGVSDETLVKMFDVFFRGDASRNEPSKGSGLGLAISKKIIQRLGGHIKAANASGGGLMIEVTLPVTENRGDAI